MEFTELQDIIDFAIDKEQEAMDFYNELAVKVKEKAIAEELSKMALIEQSHRDWLKNMDVKAVAQNVPKPVQTLKIADYLVEKEPSPDMNWQDILHIAMKRELASMNLYTDLAKLVTDPTAKQMFQSLVAEESKHKLYFEKIWDEEILKDN
ncbi:MAG: ferritin family protein [Pseudomonadota bacterium]